MASIDVPYCCRGGACDMRRYSAGTLRIAEWTRDFVTGRSAVIIAEILLLISRLGEAMTVRFSRWNRGVVC